MLEAISYEKMQRTVNRAAKNSAIIIKANLNVILNDEAFI
jgi:hypothetical protein